MKGDTAQWYEFNDSSVTLWDIEDLARECYGGKYTQKVTDRTTGEVSEVERDILNNAYILVYERITHPDPEDAPPTEPQDMPLAPLSSTVQVPTTIMEKIWKENREYIVEKHVFDPNYFNFVWRLICLYTRPEDLHENPPERHVMQAVELATRFVTEIFSHARANQLLPMWIKQLSDIFSSNPSVRFFLSLSLLLGLIEDGIDEYVVVAIVVCETCHDADDAIVLSCGTSAHFVCQCDGASVTLSGTHRTSELSTSIREIHLSSRRLQEHQTPDLRRRTLLEYSLY